MMSCFQCCCSLIGHSPLSYFTLSYSSLGQCPSCFWLWHYDLKQSSYSSLLKTVFHEIACCTALCWVSCGTLESWSYDLWYPSDPRCADAYPWHDETPIVSHTCWGCFLSSGPAWAWKHTLSCPWTRQLCHLLPCKGCRWCPSSWS